MQRGKKNIINWNVIILASCSEMRNHAFDKRRITHSRRTKIGDEGEIERGGGITSSAVAVWHRSRVRLMDFFFP
jgi:hypothetical protein